MAAIKLATVDREAPRLATDYAGVTSDDSWAVFAAQWATSAVPFHEIQFFLKTRIVASDPAISDVYAEQEGYTKQETGRGRKTAIEGIEHLSNLRTGARSRRQRGRR
jgi:hypothetical protein